MTSSYKIDSSGSFPRDGPIQNTGQQAIVIDLAIWIARSELYPLP